ncbi:phage tail protein [Clostridioides difficile]|uniref:phage tail protein n=3 Tax=Clostridioides difficile TaxID=1496 RepID=UPI00038D9F77|nr:phage tail protein [Clostridioides difficile]AXU54328.1 phage tail fiber protein [Clostridioides difficile]EQH03428.1 phage tail-collar fiber family protein [Clostridioides difficile DA00196]EQI68353.1 phage tail-collar fiber family protein [Clostridioides difficile Y343]EQJ91225.1 phage tail-collar fiber family protein [Clostridioides difficile P50]MCO8834520.1 phage tail protein [Clostridioides difficile]
MATDKSYYTILTDIGKAKIANASIVGEKVDFARIQLGDGGGVEYNPTEDQTALKRVVWEGKVGNVTTDETMSNCLILESLIPANVGGFIISEIGYLDSDGNLLAISKYRAAYKPTLENDGAVIDMKVKTIFVVSNVNNIELKIDPTIIFATLKDIQDLDTKIGTVNTKIDTTKTELTSNIETAKTELNEKIGDTTQLTTTDKTSLVGALNEVKTSVDSIETTAEKTSYNNATSNLTATNVQEAIDEVVRKIENFNEININTINSILPI